MKRYLLQILICLPFVSRSQEATGVTFNQNSTWSEIQAQAKSQNKFILVDCYATWCGPCKWMDKNIFPVKEAGDSVNSYFVSVRIQMDTTKADNERIKSWYPVAHQLYEQYSIDAFPTLLFFSPEGELVHRFVGASPTVADFIGLTKNARDPANQYYTMIKKYEGGYRDSIFLENLGNAAYNFASPELAGKIGDDLLSMQKDRFNKHNLEYTGHLMRKGYSLTFDFYLRHSSEIDSIMGNDYAERKLMNIMMAEDSEAVKANNFSGLPDWDKMYKNLKNKYGDYYADRITTWKKIAYYYKKNEWIEFNEVLVRYIIMYRSTIPYMQLNNFAWELFNHSNVKNELELAAGWSKETLDSKEPYLNTYYDTYANLLFKLSRKKEAIKAEEMAIKLSPENEKKEFRKTLWKMQK